MSVRSLDGFGIVRLPEDAWSIDTSFINTRAPEGQSRLVICKHCPTRRIWRNVRYQCRPAIFLNQQGYFTQATLSSLNGGINPAFNGPSGSHCPARPVLRSHFRQWLLYFLDAAQSSAFADGAELELRDWADHRTRVACESQLCRYVRVPFWMVPSTTISWTRDIFRCNRYSPPMWVPRRPFQRESVRHIADLMAASQSPASFPAISIDHDVNLRPALDFQAPRRRRAWVYRQ